MRTNSFTKNMSLKSNKELETMLEEKNKYTAEAIQALIWELENRNLLEKTSDLYKEISQEIDATINSERKEVLENAESPFEELEVPILYSKQAILGFTIFFSTIFGTVLLMLNLKEMNKPEARNQVLAFGILFTILSTVLLNYLPKTIFTTLLFNLVGYAVLTEYFWNKHLGKDLAHQKKHTGKALAISILIVFALVFLLFLPQMLGK